MDLFLSEKRKAKIASVVSQRLPGVTLVLEDIHDPHNAAAIFRTCDAFGIQNVLLVFTKEQAYNPAEVGKKTASSGHKWLSFRTVASVHEAIRRLKKENYSLYVSSLGEKAQPYTIFGYQQEKVALVVGNEHSGVSSEFMHAADHLITIPMYGMVQSLNVSVATALLIAECTQKRRTVSSLAQLPMTEQQNLQGTFAQLASSVYTKYRKLVAKGGL